MQPTVITMPDEQPVLTELAPLQDSARALVVTSKETHEIGLGYLKELAQVERNVVALFKDSKTTAFAAHKAACAAESRLLDPIKQARMIITRTLNAYEADQARLAEIERRRLEAEAKKKLEEQALAAAEKAPTTMDGLAIIDEALAEAPPVVYVEPTVAKVNGVSSRTTWSAQVTDLLALVKYVAENPSWIGLLVPDTARLNQLARSMQKELNIPGVKAVTTVVKAVR